MSYRTEYNKQRKRIKNYINRLEKSGAKVDFKIPEIPKRITEGSVSRLQKITPDKILAKTEITDYSTGEILSGRAVLGEIQRQKQGFNPETGEIFSAKAEQEIRKRDLQSDVQQALKTERQRIQDLPKKQRIQDLPRRSDIIIENALKSMSDVLELDGILNDENGDFNGGDFTDTAFLEEILETLRTYESKPEWNDWYSQQKLNQVNKLLQGLIQAINSKGKDAVAKQINMNAVQWHDLVLRVTIESGDQETMNEINTAIDNMLNTLYGAMSYDSAMSFAE